MRKSICLWVIVTFSLILVACSNNKSATDAGSDGQQDDGGVDGGVDGGDGAAVECEFPAVPPVGALAPGALTYLGAFRLPDDGDRPLTFEYGGNAMAFRPDGDPGGAADGFPGSLFISGHDRLAYGEMPDGSRVAELAIPAPTPSAVVADLPQASFLQSLSEVTQGMFDGLDELPRMGLAYLDHPSTGSLLHIAWGAHFQEPPQPSHGLLTPDLSAPDPQGPWYVGQASLYAINGYMFNLPLDWADANTGGQPLVTGRYRDGGWSGKGPTLYAYQAWTDAQGTLPAAGTRLAATTMLQYEDSQLGPAPTHQAMACYQHADQWEGASFVRASDGTEAVVFAGTKGTGGKFWYGWVNPSGSDPCIELELVDQFTTCWNADGSLCPAADLTGCAGHNDNRGWWSSRFDAQLIFYDPADLARVASGQLQPFEPQPYAALDVDDFLYANPDGVEPEMLGTGDQRLNRLGPLTYDHASRRLYLLEYFADGAKPVVHVFGVD